MITQNALNAFGQSSPGGRPVTPARPRDRREGMSDGRLLSCWGFGGCVFCTHSCRERSRVSSRQRSETRANGRRATTRDRETVKPRRVRRTPGTPLGGALARVSAHSGARFRVSAFPGFRLKRFGLSLGFFYSSLSSPAVLPCAASTEHGCDTLAVTFSRFVCRVPTTLTPQDRHACPSQVVKMSRWQAVPSAMWPRL
jgi:hypothetical protein